MEKDANEIRREIEETRARMGDAVEALAYKADVPARTTEAVHDRVESVKEVALGAVDAAQTTLGGVAQTAQTKVADVVGTRSANAQNAAVVAGQVPSGDGDPAALGGAEGLMQQNTFGLALGTAAIGFLLGSLLPVSAIERERIGPLGEKLTDSAKTAASNLVNKVKPW